MTLFSELILSQEQRAAIGSVALEASRLEDFLERALWATLKIPSAAGLVLTRRRSAGQNVVGLRDLALVGFPRCSEDITRLCNNVSNSMGDRNTMIHGVVVAYRFTASWLPTLSLAVTA